MVGTDIGVVDLLSAESSPNDGDDLPNFRVEDEPKLLRELSSKDGIRYSPFLQGGID